MYRFVDRPVDSQERGAQLLLWSVRQWIKAAIEGRCICGTISSAFSSCEVGEATDAFHLAMRTLCSNARWPLQFGSLDRELVVEQEAILLACIVAAQEQHDAALEALSRQIVHVDMAPVFANALRVIAKSFREAGLRVAPQAHDAKSGN